MKLVPPFHVEPPVGDRVVWSRRIVDSKGQHLGMLSSAPQEFVEFLLESLNENAYDPTILADIEALEECVGSLGPHDCVLDAGHELPHACDDECDLDHLTVSDLEAQQAVHADGGWRAAVEA